MINELFGENARTCENCSTKMQEFKCKLVCPKCKSFRSCSDLF